VTSVARALPLDPQVLTVRTTDDGGIELVLPHGDLRLRAADGRILLDAARGIDVVTKGRLGIDAVHLDVTTREATILADAIRTTAEEIATTVARFELRAHRIVESSVDAVRTCEGLLHIAAARARAVVSGAYEVIAKRTSIVSDEDTTIDGKRVLLG
jgi:hypothetical protein